MARSELLQAEHGDTGRPRHDEMCRRDRDIRWQVDLAADAARSDVAEQHDFAPRLCALCEDLRDGQDLHRIDDMQRALFPLVALAVGIALLCIQEAHDADARDGIVIGERLERRDADDGQVERIGHGLGCRQADAQPREGARTDADRDALELLLPDIRHAQDFLYMGHQRLRVRELGLHRQLRCELIDRSHGDTRDLRCRING